MDEIFLGECPDTKGAASRCCLAARLRVGEYRGHPEPNEDAPNERVGQTGERVLLASPGSVLDAAMCRVAPEIHRQPKTPHAPAADKDSERCIKRTNLLIWTI